MDKLVKKANFKSICTHHRNSHPEVLYLKLCSRKFRKTHWETPVSKFLLNRDADWRPANLSKRSFGTDVFK